MTRSLTGRTALITGASRGLGSAIARAFVAAGGDVMICARSAEALEAIASEVRAAARPDQRVLAQRADVAEPDDVAAVTAAAVAAFGRIDVLVNNAGVYGPLGPIESIDWDGWIHAIRVNLIGSVLCCRAVVPHMKAQRYGKIVQLSGGGATNPLPNISAYAASKAAIVRFCESLALEVRPYGIDVNAIAPGALNTHMMDEIIAAGPGAVGAEFYARMQKVREEGGTPLESGAALAVFLASADSDGITGRLLSAVWDPWERLPALRAELDASDVYTLRRIVPGDRGLSWDR